MYVVTNKLFFHSNFFYKKIQEVTTKMEAKPI